MFPILKQPRIELEWNGKAENEIGVVKSIDKDKFQAIILLLTSYSLLLNSVVVSIDPNYYRPLAHPLAGQK